MREWRVMLGPFLIWTVHFMAVYALASVADLSQVRVGEWLPAAGLAVTAVCGFALTVALVRSRRDGRLTPLARQLAGAGYAASLIAIAWQSLPLVLSG